VLLPDNPAGSDAVRRQVAALARFVSIVLALHVMKVKVGSSGGGPPSTEAASSREGTTFPSWLSEQDRKLLELPSPVTTNNIIVTPDAELALDGSRTHTSINEGYTIGIAVCGVVVLCSWAHGFRDEVGVRMCS
jgi:hypothetical protein